MNLLISIVFSLFRIERIKFTSNKVTTLLEILTSGIYTSCINYLLTHTFFLCKTLPVLALLIT